MDSKGFKDIEDFYSAHRERFKEYLDIEKIESKPKILMMHLGGVVIETYIKYVLKTEKSAEKVKGKLWYTIEGFNIIKGSGNLNKREYAQYSCYEHKDHSIEKAIQDIDFLNDRLTDRRDIINDIKLIENPLNEDRESFIDLRYKSVDNIDDVDEIFDRWQESFKRLLTWLRDNTSGVEINRGEVNA